MLEWLPLAYVTVIAAVGVRRWSQRRAPTLELERLWNRSHGALRDGISLAGLRAEVRALLARIEEQRASNADIDAHTFADAENELHLLAAVLAMDEHDPGAATAELDRVSGHATRAAKEIAAARLALWSGSLPGYTSAAGVDALWRLLERDGNAQVDLVRGERAHDGYVLPVTSARIRAAAGDDEGACAILARLDPLRRDAMLRAFPEDPATKAWIRRNSGPYR